MKKTLAIQTFTKSHLPLVLCLLLTCTFLVGCCCINVGDIFKSEYKRTERSSSSITAGQVLDVHTDVGSIKIVGGDFTDCNVTAEITAKAATEEKARTLAEETKIKLESAGNMLRVVVEKPLKTKREAIFVSFNVTVPKQTPLNLGSNVGEMDIANITESIEAVTNVGKINCRQITNKVNLTTNVGEISVSYAKDAPAACCADISTDVGEIEFCGPDNLSAKVHVSANVGSIETHLPLTVIGKISKSLDGTVGNGQGRIALRTSVGSISIR